MARVVKNALPMETVKSVKMDISLMDQEGVLLVILVAPLALKLENVPHVQKIFTRMEKSVLLVILVAPFVLELDNVLHVPLGIIPMGQEGVLLVILAAPLALELDSVLNVQQVITRMEIPALSAVTE